MKKILILNTELGTQMQIYLALCDAYKIEIAEDVESVMYYLRKMKPEIFLLDYNLQEIEPGGRNGADLVKKIKRKYSHLKVMMILDTEDRGLESQAHQYGADEVLFKPIKNRNLISYVNRLATTTVAKSVLNPNIT
ncbi:MAG: response regulator [bacterium]